MSHESEPPARGRTRYFSATGCVVEYPDRRDVFVGGSLIGMFTADDVGARNTLIVAALGAKEVKQGDLAKAFGVSRSTVRSVLRRFEAGGFEAVARPRGTRRKLTPKLFEQLSKLFEQGLTIVEAHQRIKKRVSRTLVGRAHKRWADEKKAEQERERQAKQPPPQLELTDQLVVKKTERRARARSKTVQAAASTSPPSKDDATSKDSEQTQEELGLERAVARGGEQVQHLGSWIMLAMLHALRLHAYAEYLRQQVAQTLAKKGARMMTAAALRVAIDAVAISLVIGEGTVEGVRRIATLSAPTLLRHRRALSPSWARRILKRLAEPAASTLHGALATTLVRLSEQHCSERIPFYVDNHLRPYTGKNTIRKGWRMQDKRARPGVSDYWVHDEDGRPVMRVSSPEHESLVQWLPPIGTSLRNALQGEPPVLLVFDRAGAHAECMANLRNASFEFVTYERKPYPSLPPSAFTDSVDIGDERYWFGEPAKKNLRKGRGRVRRITMLSPEGEQFNILAVSDAPAKQLIRYMLGRWARQENQFKHGVERWGINQLDGRSVEPYPPDAIIPNPARNRVDRALRVARAAEGEALRKLERLAPEDPKREKLAQDVQRARAEQQRLEELRPQVPAKAPLSDTELAGKLVKHRGAYKLLLDTLRIALANAESELAARLAPHLPRGTEAKKTLQNLCAAPGTVRVNKRSVTITLSPAGTEQEHLAFNALLAQLNALPLALPGDAEARRLRFRLAKR